MKQVLALLIAVTLGSWQLAAHAKKEQGARVAAVSVEAEIVAINQETREVSLRTPMGEVITLTAGDQVKRLNELEQGDRVVTTYIASVEGDLRKPTEEELAEPWVELDDAAVASMAEQPGAGVGRMIQAVCTIEGMNRVLGTVTILDPKGNLHLIGDVEPEDMEGVTLGDTIIITYTEAVAITLEKKAKAAE
jgi:hypothetical protein